MGNKHNKIPHRSRKRLGTQKRRDADERRRIRLAKCALEKKSTNKDLNSVTASPPMMNTRAADILLTSKNDSVIDSIQLQPSDQDIHENPAPHYDSAAAGNSRGHSSQDSGVNSKSSKSSKRSSDSDKLDDHGTLFTRNKKRKFPRYDAQKARAIERTFSNKWMNGMEIGGRVVTKPAALLRQFREYDEYHRSQCKRASPCRLNSMRFMRLVNIDTQDMYKFLTFQCAACKFLFKISSHPEKEGETSLHDDIVSGSIASGADYNATRNFFEGMGVKFMSEKTYHECRSKLVRSMNNEANSRAVAEQDEKLIPDVGDVTSLLDTNKKENQGEIYEV